MGLFGTAWEQSSSSLGAHLHKTSNATLDSYRSAVITSHTTGIERSATNLRNS